MAKVLVTDKLAVEGLQVLEAARGLQVVDRPGASPAELISHVDDGMESIMNRESELLQSLCEARERLVREGLSGIEDLRLELVEEMQRVRRQRATDQRKHLTIQGDPDESS